MADIKALQKAIKDLHGLEAVHVGSEAVHETFQGKTVWQGVVEIFDVLGHSKAKRCYAWDHQTSKDEQELRYVAVLELPPVDSARKAVQVAVAAEYQQGS